jgi:flagella basal body P-ring formation protein FlgA
LALAISAGASLAGDGGTVPVPRTTIYPGTVISDELLVDRLAPPEGDGRGHILEERGDLVGKVARQTLLPDQPISKGAVREPFLIKQGQAALAVYRAAGLVISTTAVSLDAGAVGDAINLRNTDSGTTIKGVVQADGTIRVGAP